MSAPFSFDDDLLCEDCETARPDVRLRRLLAADAAAMAEGLNDLDVAKNLIAVPHPYGLPEAETFLSGPASSRHMLCAAIAVDGRFAGCVAVDGSTGAPELGYWLAKPFWGQGVASLATRAMVDVAFAATPVEQLKSGHFVDNEASAAVLAKLGFRRVGFVETRSRARETPARLVAMSLDRATWATTQPSILTQRLRLAPPALADADEIARLADDRSVALMTAASHFPYSRADARAFVLAAARRARPASASFALRLRSTGALAGGAGWSAAEPGVVELGFWLGAAHRGVGLATEAARAVLETAFAVTGVTAVKASCRVINPASRGVLERCGFQWEGAGLMRSPAVAGAIPVNRFRLEREVFDSLKAWGAATSAAGGAA